MNVFVVSVFDDAMQLVPIYLLESDSDIVDTKEGLSSYLDIRPDVFTLEPYSFKIHSSLPTLDKLLYLGGHFIAD